MNVKHCFGCQGDYPATREYFFKDKLGKYGLRSPCKKCVSFRNSLKKEHRAAINKKWRESKRDYLREKKRKYNQSPPRRFKEYQRHADRRGYEFCISLEEFIELISKVCYYCGECSKNKNDCGIDRLDNGVGYVLENCIPCCEMCNRMKMDYTIDDFLCKVKLIYERAQET